MMETSDDRHRKGCKIVAVILGCLILAIGLYFIGLTVAIMIKMAGSARDLDMTTAEDRAFVESLTSLSFPPSVVWEHVRFESAMDSILYGKFRIPRKELDELLTALPIQWQKTANWLTMPSSSPAWFDPETIEKYRFGKVDRLNGKNSYVQILYDDSPEPDAPEAIVTVYLLWFNT